MESGVKGVPHAITYGGTVSSRLTYNVSCGPLKRSREWLVIRTLFIINDSDNSPEGADEDDPNAAECRKILALCLLAFMSEVFLATDPDIDHCLRSPQP